MTARAAAVTMFASVTLAACTTTQTPAPGPVTLRPAPPAGLERVIGQNARSLAILFGAPDQDQREPGARRLQYASGVCVLDAYLYPPATGKEPVVTWIDARRPTGEDFDRASCIAALSRRVEAR